MDEKRQNKRRPANWTLIRLSESDPSSGRLFNISETGLSFMYNATLEIGRKVAGVINLKDLVGKPCKVESLSFDMEVVWQKKNHIASFNYSYGAKFDLSQTGLDDAARAELIRFLEREIAELFHDSVG